ncbi:MAG: hypothetical protein IKS72_03410 [Prevotella sp.]|nr:hypothetical protein [Prevotella sp.]
MKKVLLMMCLAFSLGASAQNVESVGTVELGSSYEEALAAIKAEFGDPQSVTEDEVILGPKKFRGFSFDEMKFRFKNGKFNEARFYSKVGSKAEAQKKMENIAQTMRTKYELSRDVEEDLTWFYKGGRSPLGIGHLFTIYTYRKQGAYGVELRYGPINFPQ